MILLNLCVQKYRKIKLAIYMAIWNKKGFYSNKGRIFESDYCLTMMMRNVGSLDMWRKGTAVSNPKVVLNFQTNFLEPNCSIDFPPNFRKFWLQERFGLLVATCTHLQYIVFCDVTELLVTGRHGEHVPYINRHEEELPLRLSCE